MNYQSPKLVEEIIKIIDSQKFLEINFVLEEDIQGCFQFRDSYNESQYEKCEYNWDEIEGWEIELGNYNSSKPIFEGSFVSKIEHRINVDWLKSMLNKFIESGQRFEHESEPLYLWEFFEYGITEDLFDIQSETGLFGKGHSFESNKETLNWNLFTYNNEQIEVAKIFQVDFEERSIRFLMKD